MGKAVVHKPDRTTAQRIEAKYVVSEVEAMAILDFMQPYVKPDPYAREYPVTSLYLDSPSMELYRSSIIGQTNRHKLRIRSYGNDVPQAVFFEIKRRVDRVVKKHRATVALSAIKPFLAGGCVAGTALRKGDDMKSVESLCRFRDVMESLAASPMVVVRYDREAYISAYDEPLRITFDRRLCFLPCARYHHEIWKGENQWRNTSELDVVLEIKFNNTYPYWVGQLIRRFHLNRTSFAKYVRCVQTLRHTEPLMTGTAERRTLWDL